MRGEEHAYLPSPPPPKSSKKKKPRPVRWATKLAKQGSMQLTSSLPFLPPMSPSERPQFTPKRRSSKYSSLFRDHEESDAPFSVIGEAWDNVPPVVDWDSLTPIPPPFSPSYCEEREQNSHKNSPRPAVTQQRDFSQYYRVEWHQGWDPSYACYYYHNDKTKESQWEQPDAEFRPFVPNKAEIFHSDDAESSSSLYLSSVDDQSTLSNIQLEQQEKIGKMPQSFRLKVDIPPRSCELAEIKSPMLQSESEAGDKDPHPIIFLQDLLGCSIDEARTAFQKSSYDLNRAAESMLESRTTKAGSLATPRGTVTPKESSISSEILTSPFLSDKKNTKSDFSLVPEEFECSITMQLMEDPVVAADGHSYERAALEAWLVKCDRSPKTNKILTHKVLTPNHSLRSMINEFSLKSPYGFNVMCGDKQKVD